MKPARTVLVLSAIAVLLAGCGFLGNNQPDRLPDVSLDSLTGGDPVDLGELRGPVVVNLWAQWCKPCRRELPIYEQFYRQHAHEVPVIGVDWQDVLTDRARAMAHDSGVTYPLVVDREPEIHATGLPRLVLLDGSGRIAYAEYVEITSLGQLERLVERHLGVTL